MMTNAQKQIAQSLNPILKSVSRSFYLSIRILPSAMREPIAIAYLLARAADAIADANFNNENNDKREKGNIQLHCLLDFRALLYTTVYKAPFSLNTIIEAIDHEGEKTLLSLLPDIFGVYHALPSEDQKAVSKVVTTLTRGMEKDLRLFSTDNQTSIIALADEQALDEYTYLVAGCVGEFWTDLSIRHTPSLIHWKTHNKSEQKNMSRLGIQFGKALQLTNILRDVAKDAKLKRCYLPVSDLKRFNLTTHMLLDKNNNQKFVPIMAKWLKQADTHFQDAEAYLLSIPRLNLRLRLASLWPILIGLATLKKIKQRENFLDINENVKVKRAWVYKMLLLSIPASFSNTLIHLWIKHLKKAN